MAVLRERPMLDFLGFIATLALMVLAVNAVITFMGVSPSAKLTLATLAGLWIGIAAAAGSAGMIAISKPFPVVGLFVAVPLVTAAIATAWPPARASHAQHTDATNDWLECGSCLGNLVSVAGCRGPACGSVPALRRLGRHHHRRLCLARGVARDGCANETSQCDRCMGSLRRGRSSARSHTWGYLG